MRLPRVTKRRIIVAALVTLSLGWFGWRLRNAEQAFDPIEWQDPLKVKQGARLGMADHLLAQGTLRGKARSEVVKLLGEPSDEGYFRDWDLVYWLGPERGFMSIDSEWLVVRLGRDGRVAEYRIVRD
jgi:hypothetical protein